VTWTAIAFGILQHPRQRHSRERRAQTQQIIGKNVRAQKCPLPLLEVGHGLKSVAGESCKRAAETNHDEQAPARIGEDALRGPGDEKSYDQAAGDVDDEGPVRKNRAEKFGRVAADNPAGIGDIC
jgi:hypothetical protein